jgi:hypothetical protein
MGQGKRQQRRVIEPVPQTFAELVDPTLINQRYSPTLLCT